MMEKNAVQSISQSALYFFFSLFFFFFFLFLPVEHLDFVYRKDQGLGKRASGSSFLLDLAMFYKASRRCPSTHSRTSVKMRASSNLKALEYVAVMLI